MQNLTTLRWLQGIAGFVLFGGLAAMVLLEMLVPRDASVRSLRRVLHGTHNLVLVAVRHRRAVGGVRRHHLAHAAVVPVPPLRRAVHVAVAAAAARA